jgi:hypothetical protein
MIERTPGSSTHRIAGTVERHLVDELDERLLQPGEVVAVGVHVVGVDVRDDGHHREQVEERRVRLVGLDDDVVARAEARVGAGRVEAAADDEGRVEPGLGEDAGDEARRRRLAVRARRSRCPASGASARRA